MRTEADKWIELSTGTRDSARSMFDRFHPSPVLGVFRLRPIDEAHARELIEYRWTNGRIVDFGRPLSRGLVESESEFAEEIHYRYTVGGGWGMCDSIVPGRAIVRVNKTTGMITREVDDLREVNGVCYEERMAGPSTVLNTPVHLLAPAQVPAVGPATLRSAPGPETPIPPLGNNSQPSANA